MSEGFYYNSRSRLLKLLFQVQLAATDKQSLFRKLRCAWFGQDRLIVLFIYVLLAQLKLYICPLEHFLFVEEWILPNVHAFRLIQQLGLVEQVVQSQSRLELFEMKL